jgi:hypothetical protein
LTSSISTLAGELEQATNPWFGVTGVLVFDQRAQELPELDQADDGARLRGLDLAHRSASRLLGRRSGWCEGEFRSGSASLGRAHKPLGGHIVGSSIRTTSYRLIALRLS